MGGAAGEGAGVGAEAQAINPQEIPKTNVGLTARRLDRSKPSVGTWARIAGQWDWLATPEGLPLVMMVGAIVVLAALSLRGTRPERPAKETDG